MNNIRNFCIIAHVDHGKSTLADRLLELTHTIDPRFMKPQFLDQLDLERERGITIKLAPVRMLYQTSQTDADYSPLLYEDLTYKIRDAAFRVKKNLGLGHKEIIYQNALEKEFANLGLNTAREPRIDICYDENRVGVYQPDFVINDEIIVEIKALSFIGQREEQQIWSYLKGSNHKLLLLINFGSDDVHFKRIIYDCARSKNSNQSLRESVISQRQFAQVEYILNLIDTPGHADFSYEVSRSLAAVEGAVLLVDATQGIQAQTLTTLYQALDLNLTIIPAVNKIDSPQADASGAAADLAKLLGINSEEVLHISGKTGQGVVELIKQIIAKLPSPAGNQDKPLRALVFDSTYDPYRGVIAMVRVVDGKLSAKDRIEFFATKTIDEVLEAGIFRPKFVKTESLSAGEIGYVVTGLKDVSQARVGDTITHIDISKYRHTEIHPLPGYKEPMPMVFAGIYPSDGEVDKLREALAKLKLNDAALFSEPTSSKAFGLGFRVGFLGLLHMEIVKERLEREHNLDLVVTVPSVNYQEKIEGGHTVYAEPWVRTEILTPEPYLGAVMDLAQRRRGIYQSTEYLGVSAGLKRVLIRYEMPLAELITDFYDELKSRSSGYASMSYEFLNYREEDLVKMDILVAEELIDVLSQVVHRAEAERRARAMVSRLKELIPRQWFEVKIQAVIGGKILARESISALKKDVTGYLYGGDITRKRKLWDKQVRGKKRMKKMGRVTIPDDVFIQILKKS